MQKLKIQSNLLHQLPKEARDYILHLEACLNGASELTNELNLVSNAIAEEIKIVREKGDILANDKYFDKIMTLIDKSSKLKALSEKKEVVKEEEPEEEQVERGRKNIQDFVMKKHA